jgi:hypothetical protein
MSEQVSITLVVLDLQLKLRSLVYRIISPKVFFMLVILDDLLVSCMLMNYICVTHD